jgi:hypothetical protein
MIVPEGKTREPAPMLGFAGVDNAANFPRKPSYAHTQHRFADPESPSGAYGQRVRNRLITNVFFWRYPGRLTRTSSRVPHAVTGAMELHTKLSTHSPAVPITPLKMNGLCAVARVDHEDLEHYSIEHYNFLQLR